MTVTLLRTFQDGEEWDQGQVGNNGKLRMSLFLWWYVLFPSTHTFSNVLIESFTPFSFLVHGRLCGPQYLPVYLLTVVCPHWHCISTIVESTCFMGSEKNLSVLTATALVIVTLTMANLPKALVRTISCTVAIAFFQTLLTVHLGSVFDAHDRGSPVTDCGLISRWEWGLGCSCCSIGG